MLIINSRDDLDKIVPSKLSKSISIKINYNGSKNVRRKLLCSIIKSVEENLKKNLRIKKFLKGEKQ